MKTIAILGRLPAIGTAELEAVFGAQNIQLLRPDIAQITSNENDPAPIINSLGGTLKMARVIDTIYSTEINKIIDQLTLLLPLNLPKAPNSKINLGLSFYGFNISPAKINANALTLKKKLKNSGINIRTIPNKESELNSAQVLHNKLTREKGLEIILIKHGPKTVIAKTLQVQDIDAYSSRDQARPARDARVGMLPPKLAQTIINLSGFHQNNSILDPFCGTGVILQEASLMGAKFMHGSDLEARMVDYSKKNLEWFSVPENMYSLGVADATSHKWRESFDVIACETYLGRPLSSTPDSATLQKIVQDCDTIHKKFLQNVARQTNSGFKMCIAVPAWKVRNGFRHLKTLDHLEELGYNRMSFEFASNKDLIYHREGQQVARELVVLTRK